MNIDWSTCKFADLKAEFEKDHSNLDDPGYTLGIRYGNIMNYLGNDRIWLPIPQAQAKIIPCLCEVLARLPDDDFYTVDDKVFIIVQEDDVLAWNVPLNRASSNEICTVIFFKSCTKLSATALIGLIAHELAHTFVDRAGADYKSDEDATNAKAQSWGFAFELDCLDTEQQLLTW